MSLSEQYDFIKELQEKFEELHDKINKIKKEKSYSSIIHTLISVLSIGAMLFVSYVNINHEDRNLLKSISINEKLSIEKNENDRRLNQLKNENDNRIAMIKFKYEVESNQLKEKKETSDKLYSGLTDFSIYLFRHEQICYDKSLTFDQKNRQLNKLNSNYKEAFNVIKSIHDTDGILGEEVRSELDKFGPKFAESSIYFNVCKNTPIMLTSDDVKLLKRNIERKANKNIEDKQTEINNLLNSLNSKTDISSTTNEYNQHS